MLFNSLAYGIFLPCVFILYWILPHKIRWPLLLVASYFFYMSWNASYIILIVSTTVVSWICALCMEKTGNKRVKKLCIAIALLISLGLLFVFKYYNFTLDVLEILSSSVHIPRLDVLLPVGISFYTFQTLSYVIDVYHGKTKAEKNFGVYATFVSFFPQLVAGPIERSSNLMPQITSKKSFDYNSATYGIRLILWGLYKKMVIADNLAVFVDRVFNNVHEYTGSSLIIACFFFSIQIYCDFSGYSDIARGSAKLLGIDLMENFKSPYFSSSIREFWSRWHISLSTWFRDYVYIPLGGNRVSKIRTVLNCLITFLISGLWHGASVTYVVWGGIHGVGQTLENLSGINKMPKRWRRILGIPFVFLFVTVVWIFFRAHSLADAVYVLSHLFVGFNIFHPVTFLNNGFESILLNWELIRSFFLLYFIPLAVYDYFSLKTDVCSWIGKQNHILRYLYIIAIILVILLYSYVGQSTFVYFQF